MVFAKIIGTHSAVVQLVPACRLGRERQKIVYIVYALVSKIKNGIYVGMTGNIEERISYHNSGRVKSTKGYRPWSLLYKEEVPTRIEARIREKKLKSGYGKEFLKTLIPR